MRLTATPQVVVPTGGESDVAVSPDGAAYRVRRRRAAAVWQLYVTFPRPAGLSPDRQRGGHRGAPFFSPDGQSIGFFDGALLKRVSIERWSGGYRREDDGCASSAASWAVDDTIIFATNDVTGLLRVPGDGGEPTALTKPAGKPGSPLRRRCFPVVEQCSSQSCARAQPITTAQIAVFNLESRVQKVLVPGVSHGQVTPQSGHLVFGFSGALRAVLFNLDTLEVRGNAVPVVERVVTKSLWGRQLRDVLGRVVGLRIRGERRQQRAWSGVGGPSGPRGGNPGSEEIYVHPDIAGRGDARCPRHP